MKTTVIDENDRLCADARKTKAGIQAAGLKPLLANTTYRGVEAEVMADLDAETQREADAIAEYDRNNGRTV